MPKACSSFGKLEQPRGQAVKLLATALIMSLSAAPMVETASAQNTVPSPNPNAGTAAIASPKVNTPGAPAAGANSFTEGQAKSRIEAAGYTNVSPLIKDKDGIWRGQASKAGATLDVALDYKGNVAAGNPRR
jgi:hypothetical protein